MDSQPSKYPVILVHGILAHDRGGVLNFWGNIPKTLREHKVEVFFGNTDAWGGYASNAEMLKRTVDRVLEKTKTEKINIIAHSKGGIDSRYLIWKYNYGGKVASLTTISTPHHGSEIADLVFKQKIAHSKIMRNVANVFGKLYGDANPDLYNMNCQLTTDNMNKFNETVQMDKRVYCQSLYTTMRNAFDDLMFFYAYLYIRWKSGKNDGFVSERSARWGNHFEEIKRGISHAEIVDYKKRKISGIHIPDIYVSIVNGLREKGF